MRYLITLFLLATTVAHSAERYSEKIASVLEQLRKEKSTAGDPLVAGRSESYGGRNGAFFLLAPYVLEWATKEDVGLMLSDPSPVVRILGAKRVLTDAIPKFRPEAIDSLLMDETKVCIGPLDEESDRYSIISVGEVVAALKKDPRFLPLVLEEKKPNKTPQTRPGAPIPVVSELGR